MKLDTKCPSFSPSLVSGDAGSLPVRTPLSLSSKHCVLTSPSTRRKYRNEVRNFVDRIFLGYKFSSPAHLSFSFRDCFQVQGFMNPRTPASVAGVLKFLHHSLKLKRKKNSFKIIIGFFFTPSLFLATKVTISFVYYSPKIIKCTQKP
ncbi:hypothetical protein pdam_00005464 [Pocillopora damicornis]|uniref:Uncharacterized protein n=1 Tax=Pocillopora damicornis TaxID=46731 RepID=A0A3M6U3K5_POCDA|nr:hypothetical protein pdam_00005464 [Pocillopora damicornis]